MSTSYCQIIQRNWDDLLPWPLKCNFLGTVRNQKFDSNYVEKQKTVTFQKPVTSEVSVQGSYEVVSMSTFERLLKFGLIFDGSIYIDIKMTKFSLE